MNNQKTLIDVAASVDEYLSQNDWRVSANANQGYSLGGLILNVSGKVIANYWLNHIYNAKIGAAHRSGDLHIHDLDMLSGYCAGWSLRTLLTEGFNGISGKVEANPPKHLSSAVGQMVNFLGTLQNEWAGAVAFSSTDSYLAPYIRHDNLTFKDVKQSMQELVYNLNVPSRWGSQTPFTNLTFDWVCPEDLRDQIPYIGGKEMSFNYGDLQVEMDMINRAFIELMTEGDAKGRIFTFPLPTYNITPDFPWDNPNVDLLFEMTAKYGLPYFSNFVNSDMTPKMVRSMCCRLRLDLTELVKRGNGLFGSSELTGSLGVVTINCARLGYLYKNDETTLFQHLDTLLELGKDSLEVKRDVIQHYMDNGLFPFTKRYLGTLRNHFSTLGVNGINEMIRNFSEDQHDLTSEFGEAFAIRVLDHIRKRMVQFQEETGHMYNLEATPAEGTTYRFAKEDKKRYADIIQAGTAERPYYTNSSQLPVGFTADPFEALERQDELQTKYTGGCIEKGNKVITNKGVILIEEIVRDFKTLSPILALSYNPKTGKSEWDLITDAMSINVEKHHKIKVKAEKGVEITTSDWHPFFIMEQVHFDNKCPTCAKALKNKKALAAHLRFKPVCHENYTQRQRYTVVEKRADALQAGDYILQNATNLLPAKSQLHVDLAYLSGFFIGQDCRKGDKIRFSAVSKEPLEKVIKILSHFFNCKLEPIQGKKRVSIEFERSLVLEFLSQYQFSREEKISIPTRLKDALSKENIYSFLAGLIDSNGRVDKREGKIEYFTVSEKMVNDIVEVCTIAGVLVSKKYLKHNMYRVLISAYQATLFKEKLPLQRNKALIKDAFSNRVKRQLPVVRVLTTSKVDVKDKDFYDLTTQNNHNYLAGNNSFVFIHNTVLHLYMNERISNAQACKTLVRTALENYRLPYITVTPTFSICPVHGYLSGEHEFCPTCDTELLIRKKGE